MANSDSSRREEINLISRINELKKKGGEIGDAELKELQKKEKQLKSIRKELAAINKVREEGEMKVFTLMSRVESLQKSIGKSVEGIEKRTISWSNAAYQAGIATIGIRNNTESLHGVLNLLPLSMNMFAESAIAVVDFMKEGTDQADQFLEEILKIGKGSEVMVSMTEAEVQATKNAVEAWRTLHGQIGQTVTTMVEGFGDTIVASEKLLINFDEIGTGSFSDMVGEMEKQEKISKRNLELWEERKTGMDDEVKKLNDHIKLMEKKGNLTKAELDLVKELNKKKDEAQDQIDKGEAAATTAIIQTKQNVKLAKEQKLQHQQIAAAVDAVSAPFVKLKSAMEALPFGSLISSAINLDGVMNSFKDSATDAFKKVQAGTMSEDAALKVVTLSGQTMIKTLVTGLKLVAKTMLANPILLLVVGLVAVVAAMKKLYAGTLALRKEMGLTFGHAAELQKSINMTATQFSFLGVEASDVQSIVSGIQDSMGGVGEVTDELLVSMTRLNADFGIAGGSAAKLVTQMKAVGAASDQAAISQLESVGYLAQASGVAPAAIMNSVAENTEAFAGFAKDSGKNLFKAAIAAKKLGVEFSSIMDAAEGLLDFESSIEASMEASMLLGRNINTDRARQLAFTGDIEGMQREILKQAGSEADFNKMNVLQRKALAKAFGLSVSELGSMISNQEKLNNMTQAEKNARDKLNDMLEYAGKLWAQVLSLATKLWPVIVGIGAAIAIAFAPITLAVAGIAFVAYWASKLLDNVEGLEYVIGAIVGLFALWKMHAMGIGVFGQNSLISMAKQWMIEKGITKEKQKQVVIDKSKGGLGGKTPKLPGKGAAIPDTKTVPKKGIGDKLKDLAKGLKSMSGGKVLQGALNLIPTGLGFLLLLPGLPGLLILGRAKLSKIGVNLKALGVGLKAMAGGKVAMGALNLTLASVAFALAIASIPFLGFIAVAGAAVGAGLRLLGIGLNAIGKAASTGYAFLGPLLIAALGVAMIPFAYALKLAAPGITAVAEGLVLLGGLGAGLIDLAVGVGALGLALAGWGAGAIFIGIGVAMLVAFSVAMTTASKSAIKLENAMAGINTEMTETIKKREPYESVLEGFSKLVSPLKLIGRNLGESLAAGLSMAGILGESPSRVGEKMQEGITAVMPGLLDSFGGLFGGIGKIFSGLGGFFKGIWGGISKAAQMAWGLIVKGAQMAWGLVKKGWGMLKGALGKVWEGIKAGPLAAWEGIKAGASTAWEGIKSGASAAWEKVKAGWAGLKEILAPAWEGIKAGATVAWEGIKAGASRAWEKVKAGWAGLKTGLSPVWEGIKAGASTAWTGIKSGASAAWEGIKEGWNTKSFGPVWEGLKSGATQAFTGIKDAAAQAWTGIKDGALAAQAGIKVGWDGLKSGVIQTFTGIKDGAAQAWEGLKGSASVAAEKVKAVWASTAGPEVWDKAKDLASKAMTGVKDAASSAWSGIKGVFGFSEGGIVPTPENRPQYFAEGSDVIPAALTPGEMVLTDKQQDTVGGAIAGTGAKAGGMDTKPLEAKLDRLIIAMESGNSQLSTIAGNTGEFVNTVITS